MMATSFNFVVKGNHYKVVTLRNIVYQNLNINVNFLVNNVCFLKKNNVKAKLMQNQDFHNK